MPSAIADLIVPLSKFSFGLSEALLKDVPAAKFARLATPGGVKVESNHPAFVFGHLAIYPARLAEAMGVSVPGAVVPGTFVDLFAAGKPCLDDPEGTIYPTMDVITNAYWSGYRAILDAIVAADGAVLAKPHPNEKLRDRFPSVGALATFLITSHIMMHLGQVSAWRRMMGMAPAQL
jgi:hypothetical protein